MQTITDLYGNHSEAKAAVSVLEDAGISSSDISSVGHVGETGDSNTGESAAAGAGVGAVVGWHRRALGKSGDARDTRRP
jgi:hypothetical protein